MQAKIPCLYMNSPHAQALQADVASDKSATLVNTGHPIITSSHHSSAITTPRHTSRRMPSLPRVSPESYVLSSEGAFHIHYHHSTSTSLSRASPKSYVLSSTFHIQPHIVSQLARVARTEKDRERERERERAQIAAAKSKPQQTILLLSFRTNDKAKRDPMLT